MKFRPSIPKASMYAYIIIFIVLITTVLSIITRLKAPIDGAGSITKDGRCIITAIRFGSPADKAGLQIGDIIESVGPEKVTSAGHMKLLADYRAGESALYQIRRGQDEMSKTVTFASFWSQYPWFYLALYVLILTVSTTSIIIIRRKPYDLSAQVFFIYLQLLAIAQNSRVFFFQETYAVISNVAFILSFNLFGIILLHFHLIFPKPLPIYDKLKTLLKLFYVTGLVIGIGLSSLMIMVTYGSSYEIVKFYDQFNRGSIAWMGFMLLLAFMTAIYQFLDTQKPQTRKQLRLVLIGSAFGLITPILFSIYPEFIWKMESERHLFSMLEFTNGIGTYIMTTFLAIAIFRYRIWNIEPYIRLALLYTAATIFIAAAYLSMIGVIHALTIEETLTLQIAVLLASSIIFLLLRDLVQKKVDKVFFRSSYDSAKVITRFEENLTGVYKIEDLKKRILLSLEEIFHFKSFILAFYKSSMVYTIELVDGFDYDLPEKELVIDIELNQLLNRGNIFSADELSERPPLCEVCFGELIVPLKAGDQPFGFFLLGPKRSEKSYSLQDIRVLTLLANRIVTIFKTASLYEKDFNRQLMLEQERTRIAKDIHDELGASLTRISILSEIMQTKIHEPVLIKQWSEKIHATCSEIRQEMRQIIWALNSQDDQFEGLIAFIRRYALEQFEHTPVKCVFRIPEFLPEIRLGVEERRNIFLCIKEALNNIIKHAAAENVLITLDNANDRQVLVIEDDGKGIDSGQINSTGNGINNIKKRITGIGGNVLISSEPGKGTAISLVFPDKYKK